MNQISVFIIYGINLFFKLYPHSRFPQGGNAWLLQDIMMILFPRFWESPEGEGGSFKISLINYKMHIMQIAILEVPVTIKD